MITNKSIKQMQKYTNWGAYRKICSEEQIDNDINTVEEVYQQIKKLPNYQIFIFGGKLFERVVADDFTLPDRDSILYSILFMRQICGGIEYMHQNKCGTLGSEGKRKKFGTKFIKEV